MLGGDSSFQALLAGVLSHDNNERKNAELAYNHTLETQPAVVVQQLLRCLENGQVMASRLLLHIEGLHGLSIGFERSNR